MAASDLVDKVDALLSDLLDNFNNITTYKIGDKTVEKTQALRELRELRAQLVEDADNTPYEDVEGFAIGYSDFGEDESEYHGDNT